MEQETPPQRSREQTAIVLDFLPNGYPFDTRPSHRKTPLAQAIGADHFTLLELVPKPGVFLQPYEEVYIGEGKRDKVQHINGKIGLDRLTTTARAELEFAIKELIKKREQQYVDFFNKAQPLTTRMHSLELLPGFGKKHMWAVIEKRDEKPFASFADMQERVHLMPDPEKAVVRRVLKELEGNEKHRIFVDI